MNSKPSNVRPAKRLLFDRRYGWVFDEWKEPSEDALSGGRGIKSCRSCGYALLEGLTCFFGTSYAYNPVLHFTFGKSLDGDGLAIGMEHFLINFVAGSTVKLIERPDQFSPQALKANVNELFQKMMCSVQKPNLNLLALEGSSSIFSDGRVQQMHQENSHSDSC